MLGLQELSDRVEITDLLTKYATAIDRKQFDLLDQIFTPDAVIDYSRAGGPVGNPEEIKNFLAENLGDLPRQHILSNFEFNIQGGKAQVRCLCHNPLELSPNGGEVMLWGLWYNDYCIQTSSGWRIAQKVTEPCFHWKLKIET